MQELYRVVSGTFAPELLNLPTDNVDDRRKIPDYSRQTVCGATRNMLSFGRNEFTESFILF